MVLSLLRKLEATKPFTEQEAWSLFRLAALSEAFGWTLLISGILVEHFKLPLHRYAVPIAGQIHGLIFLAYFGILLATYTSLGWPRLKFVFAAAAGVPPYGTLVFELWAAHQRRKLVGGKRKQSSVPLVILINKDLHLRQLHVSEANILFKLVDTDRKYLGRWLPWVTITNDKKDSAIFIRSTLKRRSRGSSYEYGIIYQDAIVGHISLMHANNSKTPEIGYWLASNLSGKGIMTMAVQSLTLIGLTNLGLHKIIINADPKNSASNKVAQKAGYKLSGQVFDSEIGRKLNQWQVTD